jgi:hypothetical protein
LTFYKYIKRKESFKKISQWMLHLYQQNKCSIKGPEITEIAIIKQLHMCQLNKCLLRNLIRRNYLRSSDCIVSRKMSIISGLRSQSVGYNDKQWFRITEQRIQDRQVISYMCYRWETHDTNVLSDSISVEKLQQLEKFNVWFLPKIHITDKILRW